MKHIVIIYTQANRILSDALEDIYISQTYTVSTLSLRSKLKDEIVHELELADLAVLIVSTQFLKASVIKNIFDKLILTQKPSLMVLVKSPDEVLALIPVTQLGSNKDVISNISATVDSLTKENIALFEAIEKIRNTDYLSNLRRNSINDKIFYTSPISSHYPDNKIDTSELFINLDQPKQVEFSQFTPSLIPPDKSSQMYLYIHVPPAKNEVMADFMAISGLADGEFNEDSQRSSLPFRQGTRFTVIPFIRNAKVSPANADIIWDNDVSLVNFFIRPNTQAINDGYVEGEIRISVGILVVATIPIRIRVGKRKYRNEPEYKAQSAETFNKIFISYSHKDKAVVHGLTALYRANPDIKPFVDKHEFKSGDNWWEVAQNLIQEAHAFQLCWSPNSSKSEPVEQEWKYALKIQRKILPIYFGFEGNPPIPNELIDYHFEDYEHYVGRLSDELRQS